MITKNITQSIVKNITSNIVGAETSPSLPVTTGLIFQFTSFQGGLPTSSVVTLTGANFVSVWKNINGSANDAIQGVQTRRPFYQESGLNNLPSLSFINDDAMVINNFNLAANADLSVFLVLKINSLPIGVTTDWVLDINGSSLLRIIRNTLIYNCQFGGSTGFAGAIASLDPVIINLTFDRNNLERKFYINNQLQATVGLGNTPSITNSPFTIGNNLPLSRGMNGYMNELVMYDRLVTDSERLEINEYLSEKHQIPIIT